VLCLHLWQGHISNYSHPALKYVCQEFFYGANNDQCLGALYPEEFIDLPIRALVLAATAVCRFSPNELHKLTRAI
jgi:Domain of unknown function (DUF6532)